MKRTMDIYLPRVIVMLTLLLDIRAQNAGLLVGRHRRWLASGPPEFMFDEGQNVTAQLGGRARLPCRIKNLGNKSVSWIRTRDSHILSVDRYTFIADDRFGAYHDRAAKSWTLEIRYALHRDAGRYECQISTEPKMSQFVHLSIAEPRVEIPGEKDIYVKSGSRVVINCTIYNSYELPQYIFWFHETHRIIGNSTNNLLEVHQVASHTTVGSFSIHSASINDSGQYTCEPTGLSRASVTVHVLADEEPAAMQHGTTSAVSKCSINTLVILSVMYVWLTFDGIVNEMHSSIHLPPLEFLVISNFGYHTRQLSSCFL